MCHHYYPPTQSWEGNVFSRVCLSYGHGGSHETITHDALHLPVQGRPPPSSCTGPGLVAKTVDLFKLVRLRISTNAEIWWMRTQTYMFDKRVVHILLECFLVVSKCNRIPAPLEHFKNSHGLPLLNFYPKILISLKYISKSCVFLSWLSSVNKTFVLIHPAGISVIYV